MKKLLIVGLVLFVSSCKKDYDCECTTTYTNKTTGVSQSSTDITTLTETKKKYAKAHCVSTASETTNSSYSSDCKLK